MNSNIVDDKYYVSSINSNKNILTQNLPNSDNNKKEIVILKKFKIKFKQSASLLKINIDRLFSIQSTSRNLNNFPTSSGEEKPEGSVENLMFRKSASETNLSESVPPKLSINNKDKKNKNSVIEKNKLEKIHAVLERAKSLEIIKGMPAYGEFIADSPSMASNASQTPIRRRDHLYKVLVIGDLATGKTSIIKRYVHRFFSQNYRATIGVDFALKVLNWDENTVIRLQLWDIAGQERYGNMTRVYFKEAVGAFVVFDCTRVNTFESVKNWKADLDSKVLLADGSRIPCILLANKCDQPKEGIVNNNQQMDEYCKTEGFAGWFQTSAKDNVNIDDAARALIDKILEKKTVLNIKKDEDQFSIKEESQNQVNGKKKCLC